MRSSSLPSVNSITRRSAEVGDLTFLLELYATTRDDINRANMEEGHKRQLINSQFKAQHQHYHQQFPNACFDVVCLDGERIGRLYVDTNDIEIRLIDIALLPEFRNKGIGGHLIDDLLKAARLESVPVRLRVTPDSPALRLYQGFGFRIIADEQVNLHLEWRDTDRSDP